MNANSSHNLQVALKLQQAGLSVFVAGPDKKPRVKWRKESTTDPDQIKKWFKRWPDALPAIDLAKSGHRRPAWRARRRGCRRAVIC